MKPLLTLLIAVGFLSNNALAEVPLAQGKRIQELNLISTRVLQRSISPWFFKSLCVSPIEGWVVVRANIVDTHFSGPRIIHSELDGAYDELALKLANEQSIEGPEGLQGKGWEVRQACRWQTITGFVLKH